MSLSYYGNVFASSKGRDLSARLLAPPSPSEKYAPGPGLISIGFIGLIGNPNLSLLSSTYTLPPITYLNLGMLKSSSPSSISGIASKSRGILYEAGPGLSFYLFSGGA